MRAAKAEKRPLLWAGATRRPAVVAPGRAGFGSTMISRVAIESLNGEVDLDFAPAGLSWRLECPFGEVIDRSQASIP